MGQNHKFHMRFQKGLVEAQAGVGQGQDPVQHRNQTNKPMVKATGVRSKLGTKLGHTQAITM